MGITMKKGITGIEVAVIIAAVAVVGLMVAKPLMRKPIYPYVGIPKCDNVPIPEPTWKNIHTPFKKTDFVSGYGLLIPPEGSKFASFKKKRYFPKDGSSVEQATWTKYVVPPVNQIGPSCCGHAWANWMMMMVKRYVGKSDMQPDDQIDGYAIWKRGREMFWNGNMDGGLYLSQGFLAAQDLGIIPAEAQLVKIENEPMSISQALLSTPLVCGNFTNPGWYNPSTENGCLDHGADREKGMAHATTMIGLLVQSNAVSTTVFTLSVNSWGYWGWNGLFIMMAEQNYQTTIDGPYAVEMPANWEKTWKHH